MQFQEKYALAAIIQIALVAVSGVKAGIVSSVEDRQLGAGGHSRGDAGHTEEEPLDPYHEVEAKPYKFGYGVRDSHHGLDFNQEETSDGHSVFGHYRVQLPDGRMQVVHYTADWKNGYNANVQYEGEASHPKVIASVGEHHLGELGSSSGTELGGGGSSYASSGLDHTGIGSVTNSKWVPKPKHSGSSSPR